MTRMTITRWVVLSLLCIVAGCGDDATGDGGNAGAGSSGRGGSSGTSGASGAAGADSLCPSGSTLFPAVTMGVDDNEPVGRIEADEGTGDIYFSSSGELWTLPAGAGDASVLGERPTDVWSELWLRDDEILLPSGFQIPVFENEVAVLFARPLTGGETQVRVAAPVDADPDWDFDISSVRIIGDDVVWIGIDREVDSLGLPIDDGTTYFVRKTSWRAPGVPLELYRSEQRLSRLIASTSYVFVNEEQDDPDTAATDRVQRILDANAGGALPQTAQERFLGEVMAADDESVLVTRLDIELVEDYADIGTWYVRLDGSGEEQLGDVFLLAIGPPAAVSREGTWLTVSVDPHEDVMHVQTYAQDTGLRRIGCMPSNDSTSALALTDTRALIGTFDDDKASTIVAVDR